MNALDDLLKQKTGGSQTASSGSASGEKPVSYVDALLESKKNGNAGGQLLYTDAVKASQGRNVMQTPYADAAARMKQSGTNNNFFHGMAGIFEKAAAGAKEGLRTGVNELSYRAQAGAPLNAADDAYYKVMWEQTTGEKTGVEVPKDTRTQEQKELDEFMGVGALYSDSARAMQRAAEKGYERLDEEGLKTAFKRDGTYQEKVDQKYADLGPKWQKAMGVAGSVGNQTIPIIGRIVGTALGGQKAGEALQSFLFFNQASGAAIEEAINAGASWDDALTYGTVIGGIEAATELAGDLAGKAVIKAAGKTLPKEQFTKALIGTLTNNKAIRTTLTILGQMNGEGLEEVASDLVSPFAKSIYNGKKPGQNWMDEVTLQGLWESYLGGAISGGILSGVGGAVNGQFRAQNQMYADATVNTALQEARASAKENGIFNSQTREKIIDAGLEIQNLEANQRTAAAEAQKHMQMVREAQKAMRGDAGARARLLKMAERNYTAETQNAPVGAQRAQNEGIGTTPAAAINIQEGMNNGQSTYHREESGAAYVGSRGQAAEGAEGGLQALTGGRTEVQRGVGTDAQANLRQVTPAQLGIRDGGAEAVTVVDAQKLGGEAKSAYDAVLENGLEPVAVRGAIQVGDGYANAYTESGRVFFRVDAVDSRGNAISPEMLVQHEMFHNYASEEVIRATDKVIRESMTAEEYDTMREAYKADYAGVYDFANMSVDEIERLLTEEIAADAYAGLNWFSGNATVQEAIRAETERNAPAQRAEARQETTGPPEGRGTIVVLPDGKKYVQADRQVIFGNDPDGWADQIEGYINRKIRNGEDVILTTDSGDVLKITEDTAGKASFRNYIRDENGTMRRMTDAEYEAKLNAEAHIDELAQISERINKKPRKDETARNGQPIHGEFARNGWIYRKAEFRDFDGQRYRVTISTADGNSGVVVYNVGKMQRRGSPAIKYGSSDSVTETGAQQGKSSSTVTIRPTAGNSQEKSSGRASVAGIGARTADRAALRRAEALEKSGTDNETIRQETGWYRGVDGKWRFEIDDSGATFSRTGEAQYSADNADYARYTQLMNRMLTGELTEAEHAELLGLDKKHGGTKKELARRIDTGDATLQDIMQHNALFEAYPEIAETKVKFANIPNETAGSYNRETNTITIDAKLKYDANEALDVLMHEVQHRVQAAEGFTSGTNPGYWNREETYDKAAEKYRDNRARLLNGLSAEDRALYNEYRSIDREMGAAFSGETIYDENRMDALEKRSDELYKELYGKEWFGRLNRYDRIIGDAEAAIKDFYYNTAGEIEARDTANRRKMTAEERRKTPPDLGDADTVFADSGVSMEIDADSDTEILHLKDQLRAAEGRLKEMRPVASVQSTGAFMARLSDRRAMALKKLNANKKVDRQNFGEIRLDDASIRKGIKYVRDAADLAAFEAVPAVLKRGIQINHHKQHKGGKVSSTQNVESWTFAAPITMNGRPGHLAVVVQKTKDMAYKAHKMLTPDGKAFVLDGTGITTEAESRPDVNAAQTGGRNATTDSASMATIRQTEGNSQEKSSGRASTQVESREEAERKEAEAYEAAREETKRKRTYEPIQAVGEYTEKLVRMETALETADNAVMEEGKNRYEAHITEEDGYVYAYVYKNGELLAKAKGKNRKKVPHWIANQIRIDFGERTVFHPALQERGDYDLDLKKAKKDGYPVLQKKNGERVQAVPFWTWVRSKDRGNYGLVVSRMDNTTGPDGQGVMDVFYYNKKTGKGMVTPESAVSVYAVDGKYSDMYAEEKAAARMNDEAAETRRAEEAEKLREAQKEGSPFEARENATTATKNLRTQNTSMGADKIFQQLISKGFARVKAQVTTDSPRIAEWEIQMDTNGVQYWADISLDGKKVKRIIEMKKNDAAQKAAEYVDEEANKAFTDANAERAARQAAEEQAEHDAKVAEMLGEPDGVDIIFPSESKVADEPTAAEKAESRVAENVEKKTSDFIDSVSDIWHGALRMLENAGDTVSRMAKATGNKSLEGYYFNAGAYSQRAGNWIAPGGARTDVDGKKLGKSLEDMLAPMRKDAEVYRQFNLYALHLHNIDRMKYDNAAELETIKRQLDAIENAFPRLRNQPEYVEQMAGSDEKTKLTGEHAEIILAEMAEGNPPNVSDLTEAAQLLLYARRKQAKIRGQGMKPVFGYDVTAYDSQREVKRLEAEHPEFKEWMKEVKQYSDDLLDYRVQAGLDTRESVEAMKKRYPNYVPTLRVEGTNGKAARRARRSGGITVSDAVGRAVGSDAVLLPLHTALSRKTVAVMRNAGMNMLGREFIREWSGKNKEKISDFINNVSESESSATDQQYTDDYLYKPVENNVFSVYDGGKRYDITMDEGLTVAMRAFEPDKFGGYAVAKSMKKLNDLFKALCTGYNPFFTVRNAVRDWMDAGFYSTDTKTWEKMYWSAWNQIRTNGEIWQQYKALGGSYASLLDYTTGMTKQPKNAAGRVVAKFEAISQAVEAAPRLAEFMTILANKGGSKTVNGVKTGEFTTSDYMEAMLGAADITTNFARGGTVAKALNKYAVPFLNPSIQGFSKFVRNAIETKSVKAAGSLILKAALAGVLPTLLGELMYGDDEEWEDIPPASKANYYLIKLGDGYWLKIPQGRAVAVLSTAGVYGMEAIKGNEVTFSDVFDVVKSNIAPTDIFNQNLATAFTQTKLLNPDNPGTTWYGGNIENERMQNLRPEDRYDENTDALSKLLGKTFHLSPKKINYLLDQYSGVIGDLLLPMLKPAAKAPMRILEPVYSAFTIDTTSTNVTTGQYYDLLDELKYDANDGDTAADVTRRYANHAGAEISDYYSQIREIQNDKNLNAQEKNELVRALKKQLIEREKEIISDAERYREAVENYMSANPELATDNAAAVAEFAEKYELTEDQAEDRMDAIVYREANREVFGAEYALQTYNSDVYDKARAAYAKGVSYDTYYDYYFATKDMHADKDENGKSISGSKKEKVVEYINSLDIPPEQKDALYVAAGYTEKSARNQKWNGGSGSSGGGRRGKATRLKAPAAPKPAKITIPGAGGTSGGTAAAGKTSAPKTSVNVANIAKAADVGKLREAAKKTTRTAIKAGNRTIYIEDGSPLDYFLKYGKLPSTKTK